MISIYFAEKHSNSFIPLPLLESSEYHSDWCCDLCYSNNYTNNSIDFKTIISTPSQYRRVCSDCLNKKEFETAFGSHSNKIREIILNHYKYLYVV